MKILTRGGQALKSEDIINFNILKKVDEEDLDEEAEDAAQIEEIEIEAMEAEVSLILLYLSQSEKIVSYSHKSGIRYS